MLQLSMLWINLPSSQSRAPRLLRLILINKDSSFCFRRRFTLSLIFLCEGSSQTRRREPGYFSCFGCFETFALAFFTGATENTSDNLDAA